MISLYVKDMTGVGPSLSLTSDPLSGQGGWDCLLEGGL